MAHIDQLLPMDTRRQAKHTNTIGPDHRRTISPWFMTLAKRPSWRIFKPQCQTNRLPMFSSTINFQIPNMKCTPDGQRFNLAPGTLMCSYMFLIVQKKATNRIHFMYIPPTTRGRRILSEWEICHHSLKMRHDAHRTSCLSGWFSTITTRPLTD